MPHEKRKLLDRSFQWIRSHSSATNLDVPDELIDDWIFDAPDDDQRPSGFHFSVFVFGFLQREVLTQNLVADESHSVELNCLLEQFDKWQLKLALAEIHRRTDVDVDPMPLFGFPDNEQVRFRHKAEVDLGK